MTFIQRFIFLSFHFSNEEVLRSINFDIIACQKVGVSSPTPGTVQHHSILLWLVWEECLDNGETYGGILP